ncbi:MAG: ATP-binding protein [Actinomycetota bacterium]|nr:ATP-binding protein [Actinomycetota bacterium]
MSDPFWLALTAALVGIVASLVLRLRRVEERRVQAAAPQLKRDPAADAFDSGTAQILERMGEGVLLLDAEMTPVFSNSVARAMLGFQRTTLPERLPSEEIVVVAREALEAQEIEEVLHMWFPRPIDLRVRATKLEEGSGVLVVLQDVTQELLTQRVRREFVAHASHELKSPVAGLQTLAEAIQQAVEDDPTMVAHFSKRIAHEADRLGRLVRDLLDLSRLEDPTTIAQEPADLSALARNEVEAVRSDAETKGVTLEEMIVSDIWLRGDGHQLSLLVRNLLENAIRYTPAGGRVSLEVFRRGREAFVRVSDDGIGIPREAHARVFERFYRVDRARSRDMGGTGLGLAIVKHVAEIHGGSVTLSSDLGEGSIFTARFPMESRDPAPASLESIAG